MMMTPEEIAHEKAMEEALKEFDASFDQAMLRKANAEIAALKAQNKQLADEHEQLTVALEAVAAMAEAGCSVTEEALHILRVQIARVARTAIASTGLKDEPLPLFDCAQNPNISLSEFGDHLAGYA